MGSGQFDSFRSKRSKDDNSLLGRRGSFDRGRSGYEKHHSSWSPDIYGANLDNFRPVTLTVSSFFKQVGYSMFIHVRENLFVCACVCVCVLVCVCVCVSWLSVCVFV